MAKKSSKSNRKNRAGTGEWWTEAEEVPRAGLPDAAKLARRAKTYRIFIYASVFLLPFSLLTVFITVANSGSGAVTAKAADKYASTRPVAVTAVREWLATDPSPLPGGEFVTWEKATSTKSRINPDSPNGAQDVYRTETHTMTLSAPGGRFYDTTVTLAIAKAHGVNVISVPSLTPRAPGSTNWTDASMWPQLETEPAPETVGPAVVAWAEAYTSGDPARLGLAVGDGRTGHAYIPMSGAKFTNVSVRDSAPHPEGLIVSVIVDVTWAGVELVEGATAPQMMFDLLVADAQSAAPRVVAWGGPGVGPRLKTFGNAIAGRSFAAAGEPSDDALDAFSGQLDDETTPFPED